MRFTALLAAAAALYAGPAMAAGYDDFTGNWRNDDSDGGLTRVQINVGGGGLHVRGYGQCHPSDCDWGQVNAVAYTEGVGSDPASQAVEVIATFNAGFSQTLLVLRRAGGEHLAYATYTRFTDGSGRSPYVKHGSLRQDGGGGWPPGGPGGGWPPGGPGGGWPPGGPGGGWPPGGPGGGPGGGPSGALSFSEDCIAFNWHDVQAQHVGGEWKVTQGSMWMLSFGGNQAGAERAAEIIQHYRFDQQCFIGRGTPFMTYWKRGDHVPSGGYPGDDCTGNNPGTTHAQFVGGAWKVVDGTHWMLSGSDATLAHHAEEVIHHYNLNRQCYVARPNPPMSYWLSE